MIDSALIFAVAIIMFVCGQWEFGVLCLCIAMAAFWNWL